jgi:rare lipoprotein A (peptidoglycan hydrolase)
VPPFGQRPLRALCLALTLALALAGIPALAFAVPAPSSPEIEAKREQAAKAQVEMGKMRSTLAAGMSEYTKVGNDLERTRAEIAVNGARLKALGRSLAGAQKQLKDRASYMYRTSTGDIVEVLFGAHSFDEFASRIDALTEIAERDAGLILRMKDERAESQRLRGGLKQREARQVALRARAEAHRSAIQSEITKQQRYVASLSADVADLVAKQERAKASVERTARVRTPPPRFGGTPSGGGGLGGATVEGRPGTYLVMAGQPLKYRATGVTIDGVASMYSNADNGTATASGRPFNDRELTCAHPSLPFGTLLAVSRGGNRVIVIVTDRGPYTGGRVLDLATRAGDLLGIDGIGSVHAEVVEPAG